MMLALEVLGALTLISVVGIMLMCVVVLFNSHIDDDDNDKTGMA